MRTPKNRAYPRDEIYSLAAECGQLFQQNAEDDVEYIIRRYRRKTLLEAAKHVCMYCDGRATGYDPASGPNAAGNWVHTVGLSNRDNATLCLASSIHSMLRWEEEHGVGVQVIQCTNESS